jgi:hypothetical protein
MAYGWRTGTPVGSLSGRRTVPQIRMEEGTTMKNLIKSGAFRTLMLLSALASSGLVLEAARRW